MFSINSYESNKKKKLKVGSIYYKTNIVRDYRINDLTLYKKSDLCL